MFWTIFTVLLIAAIVGFVIGITDYSKEWLILPTFAYIVFGTFIWVIAAGETESKVSDKEQVCFEMPVFTKQAMFIYTNDGVELKGETIKDAHFPYEKARCYKREHLNHYGNVIKTSYTFEVGVSCEQSRTFYID